MNHRKPLTDRVAIAFAWLLVAVIVLVVLGVRLLLTGGDVACVFADDPVLCAAVKGIGR